MFMLRRNYGTNYRIQAIHYLCLLKTNCIYKSVAFGRIENKWPACRYCCLIEFVRCATVLVRASARQTMYMHFGDEWAGPVSRQALQRIAWQTTKPSFAMGTCRF